MNELKSDTLLQGGKYRIEKVLGQGGFGITYLAEQTNLGRKVCIKEFFMKEYGERTAAPVTSGEATVMADDATILTGNAVSGGAKEASAADGDATVLIGVSAVTSAAAGIMGKYREKFVKEARTIARLDHPGIVRIHDVFEENGTAYYVMDFIEGENLNDLVKREGALSEERALGYIRQIADALSFVHSHNIMHLDVKPANVLVRRSDDKAILIDFGTAKQYDSTGTQTSTTPVGLSVGYAPIELTKPGGVQTFSPETDVYSLGATLYYLLTGQNPPDASERMEMLMEGEKFQFPDTVSLTMASAIEQALQSSKKRPQTVTEFTGLLPALNNAAPKKKRPEFCPNCGEKLTPSTKFCPNCGTTVTTSNDEEKEAKQGAETELANAEVENRAQEEKITQNNEKSTANGLVGISVFLFIGGLVMLTLGAANVNGYVWYSSFDPFGYIGFGVFCGSAIFSSIALSRKKNTVGLLIISLLLGIFCLVSAIREDNIRWAYMHRVTQSSADSLNVTIPGTQVQFSMVLVKAGSFDMGSSANVSPRKDDETLHRVTLTKDYYMGEYEVTQELYETVMGYNPSYFKGARLPVENVSWDDAQAFCTRLSSLTGRTFRLPTEAEWEYAARGGTTTSLYNGQNIQILGECNSPNLDPLAWYGGNCGRMYIASLGCDVSNGYDISELPEKQYNDSKGGTHPVGQKQPNGYGLYDMLGNVWEWCQDWYGDYGSGAQTNSTGPSTGSYRVWRGGSWLNYAPYCRVSFRYFTSPSDRGKNLGFRLVCVPQ